VAAEKPEKLSPWIRMFQIMAVAEAITWVGLLVGMLFKYVVASNAAGVKAFGPLHGLVMVLYLMACGIIRPDMHWTKRQTLIAAASSVPPLMTLPFERWAMRRYRALPVELQRNPALPVYEDDPPGGASA
jgi:integral membrane protein